MVVEDNDLIGMEWDIKETSATSNSTAPAQALPMPQMIPEVSIPKKAVWLTLYTALGHCGAPRMREALAIH